MPRILCHVPNKNRIKLHNTAYTICTCIVPVLGLSSGGMNGFDEVKVRAAGWTSFIGNKAEYGGESMIPTSDGSPAPASLYVVPRKNWQCVYPSASEVHPDPCSCGQPRTATMAPRVVRRSILCGIEAGSAFCLTRQYFWLTGLALMTYPILVVFPIFFVR